MICKICGKVFSPFKLYEVSVDLKADSFICKGCFLKETLRWNIENPQAIKTVEVFNDYIIVGSIQ